MSLIQKKSYLNKTANFEEKLKEAAHHAQQGAALNSPSNLCGNNAAMFRKPYSPAECKALLAGFWDGVEFAARLSGSDTFINGEVRTMLVDLGGHLRRLEAIDATAIAPTQAK